MRYYRARRSCRRVFPSSSTTLQKGRLFSVTLLRFGLARLSPFLLISFRAASTAAGRVSFARGRTLGWRLVAAKSAGLEPLASDSKSARHNPVGNGHMLEADTRCR